MSADKSTEQTGKKMIPPYMPFKTFKAFIDGLKTAMPNRIDRSLMTSMSGTIKSQLEGALKFLRLIDANGTPTDKFRGLAEAEGEAHQKVLRNILREGYPFLFGDSLDLQKATPKELDEKFEKAGAGGDTVRKAVAFFLAGAKEAGVLVSPHIAKRTKRGPRGIPKARRSSAKRSGEQKSQEQGGGFEGGGEGSADFKKALLAKLPEFNPEWDDKAKASWLETYKEVIRIIEGANL